MLNVLEEAVAVESSRQVDSTPMFIGKETCTTSHNMITGSSLLSSTNRPLGSIESEKNTNHEGVSLITSPAKAPGYNEEGLCSNNTIIDVATITTANQYYRHPDQMVQMGSHHLPLYPAVPHKQHNIIAAAEDSHPTCKTGQLGNASLHIQPQPGHYSQYDTDQLRLPQLQALSHLQAASNHLCSTEVLTQLEPLQPAGGTDHAGVPCVHGMAFKTTVQQHSRALEAAVMHRQGKADEYVIERERHSVRRAVQMQHMNKSPEGSSMVSIYNMDQQEQEQEGVHRNGGSCSVGGSTQMNRWGQYNVMQVHLDIIQGQSLQMRSMKKRRLTNEQVKSLEGSFETESKLEAERKKELAQELGLQPRQVAVWFQNRRARFKAKQLERDFHLLNRQYHALLSEKDTLLAQVAKLKDLLDAKIIGKSRVAMNDTQGKKNIDEDKEMQHLSPDSPQNKQAIEGRRKKKAIIEDATSHSIPNYMGNQEAPSNKKVPSIYRQHANCSHVLSNEILDQAHVHKTNLAMDQAPKSFPKGSCTLEVKPSLQVPPISHYYYQQHQEQNFPNTVSPPTNLSLCSPQQSFLHHMVAMNMDSDSFSLAQYEPHSSIYNHHYNFHHNREGEDRSESMICFNSTWHHDP